MRISMSAFALAALTVSGCTTIKENRVESALVEAGISAGMAGCMAEIWADDLSVGQLRGISRFADSIKEDGRSLTVGRLVAHVREWNDPEALGVVTTSAARCALS